MALKGEEYEYNCTTGLLPLNLVHFHDLFVELWERFG